MAIKSRIFNVMQYERHPETGEVLLLEDKIKDCVAHRTIKRWAYIRHDEDVYSALDEEHNPNHRKGELKPPHWHVVIEMGTNQVEIGVIARWLGIKDNYVQVAKGAGAVLDCAQYLTHEDDKQQGLGKRLYDDSRVKANFEFRKALDERQAKKAKYGRDLSDRDKMRYDVLYEGKTLRQCMAEDRLGYMDDMEKLKKLRMEYIGGQRPPATRINYYVTGRGGIGKGLICRALARSLFPQYTDDEDVFFEVGAKGAAFEGYDGQPVIIWNDRRAVDLLQELNGRGNVFNVFDTHPTKQKQNIKYGSVNLCNLVNIVNSVQTYAEFLDGLAGEYTDREGVLQKVEDKGQSYRRFPFMIVLHEDDFDLMLNRGFLENTNDFQEYIEYKHIRGNMQRIAEACGKNEALARELQGKAVQPIVDKHYEVLGQLEASDPDEDKIRAMFADVGTRRPEYEQQSFELIAEDDAMLPF